MKLLHGFERPDDYRCGFVSIGNFDGVHRGHQNMIAALVRNARAARRPAVVLTFNPHPIELLRPHVAPPNLSTLSGKVELLGGCGVDCVIAYPTDWNLLNLTPDQFFQTIVCDEMNAAGLVEGPNFFFGHNRAGNVETLRESCAAAGLAFEVVPPTHVGSRLVSSSAIRSLIASGQLAEAVELLGHPYRIRGTVSRGAARGRTIGFPTANLTGIETLLPANGVYAGIAHVPGAAYRAAVHIGPNPTFGESERKVEVHAIGFSGDLYGTDLDVDFHQRVRDTMRFERSEDLQKQLACDVETAMTLVVKQTKPSSATGPAPVV